MILGHRLRVVDSNSWIDDAGHGHGHSRRRTPVEGVGEVVRGRSVVAVVRVRLVGQTGPTAGDGHGAVGRLGHRVDGQIPAVGVEIIGEHVDLSRCVVLGHSRRVIHGRRRVVLAGDGHGHGRSTPAVDGVVESVLGRPIVAVVSVGLVGQTGATAGDHDGAIGWLGHRIDGQRPGVAGLVVGQDIHRGGRGVLGHGRLVVDSNGRIDHAVHRHGHRRSGTAVEGIGERVLGRAVVAVVRVRLVGQTGTAAGDGHSAIDGLGHRLDGQWPGVAGPVVGQHIHRGGGIVLGNARQVVHAGSRNTGGDRRLASAIDGDGEDLRIPCSPVVGDTHAHGVAPRAPSFSRCPGQQASAIDAEHAVVLPARTLDQAESEPVTGIGINCCQHAHPRPGGPSVAQRGVRKAQIGRPDVVGVLLAGERHSVPRIGASAIEESGAAVDLIHEGAVVTGVEEVGPGPSLEAVRARPAHEIV